MTGNSSSSLITAFLQAKRLEGRSPATITSYGRELREVEKHIAQPLAGASTQELRAWLRSNDRWAAGTVCRKIAVLRSFFKWALEEELVSVDPAVRVKTPKKSKPLPKWLNIEQLQRIFAAASEDKRTLAIISLLYETGCRVGEIYPLCIGDFDFKDRQLKVLGKGSKERVVIFGEATIATLGAYWATRGELSKDAPAFTTRDGSRLSIRLIQSSLSLLGKKVGIHLTPHKLRHSFASHLVQQGVPILEVSELLGHSDISTTTIYAKTTREKLREAHGHLPRVGDGYA